MDAERIYRQALENAHAYALQAEAAIHEPVEVRDKHQNMSKTWALVAMAASMDPNYPLEVEDTRREIVDVYSDLL